MQVINMVDQSRQEASFLVLERMRYSQSRL